MNNDLIHLFPILDQKLIDLLRSLQKDDWNRMTLAREWSVKDVAAHLLDGNLRMLSFCRDKFPPEAPDRPIDSYAELVGFLNRLNADWVNAYKRVSPEVLTDQLEITGKQYSVEIAKLDPGADAMFAVAWAGEAISKNSFHIAREYTEKWHHQQQIREAVGIPGIMEHDLYSPVIDTFLRGLPHTYRHIEADPGTVITIHIVGEAGGDWSLVRKEKGWILSTGKAAPATASISIPEDIAWKLFTKAIKPLEAEKMVTLTGDHSLARIVLQLVAVMA